MNKRPDGYHNINTVFYPIDIFDLIELKSNENDNTISVEVEGMNIPEEDNLVFKAAKKLQKKSNTSKGVSIKLTKNIPSGAGLGGGSANAAVILLALKSIWKLDVSNNELFIIATSLGADVPFFLRKGAAEGKSRGERLNYLNYLMPFKVAVVNPGLHISTPEAYKALDRDESPKPSLKIPDILYRSMDNPSLLASYLKNDFEDYAFSKYPEIEYIKKQLYKEGAAFALMSGSGSSVFGLFEEDFDFSRLKNTFSDYKVMIENKEVT
ncbi:MAG: 4-(cytidine 5'-diphospho)-2-C-methyl-D-erythritol kinase [Candidatus Kapaibacteriales bacterium]